MKKIIISLLLGIFVMGCTPLTVQPKQKSNLTVGMIKKNIVKGQTGQTEILSLFGAPNLITTSSEGKEVWTYSKSSYDTVAEEETSGWGLIGYKSRESAVLSSATTSSMDLIIVFDEIGIVEKYNLISASY